MNNYFISTNNSGADDVFVLIIALWWSLCSIERNHLSSFKRKHCGEYFEFGSVVQQQVMFIFSGFRSGRNCFLRSETVYAVLLYYCTSNGTQFSFLKILFEGFFTLKICMRIDKAKP